MTSKERILKCLARQPVDRLPVGIMTFTPDITQKFEVITGAKGYNGVMSALGIDIKKLKLTYRDTPAVREEFMRRYNQQIPLIDVHEPYHFMETFGVEAGGTYSAVGGRIFEDITDTAPIEKYPWPDVDWLDYDLLSREMDCSSEFALAAADWSPIFGALCEFFGMEGVFINMMSEPELIDCALEHIVDYFYRRNAKMYEKCAGKFELLYIGDDFASAQNLMISLETFNRFFRKPLQLLFDQAKSYGLHIFEHCCGAMAGLLPTFIDMGVDVVEPCQFHIPSMEPRKLKREYGNDIIFHGGVNSQQTLPFGTPEQVRAEVRELFEIFHDGGLILCSDHCLLGNFPVENMYAMYEEAALCRY